MNSLLRMDGDIYQVISGSECDPFHQDSRIGRFYTELAKLIES